MKRERVFDTLCEWIAIPSVSGAEADYADALAHELAARGFDVERQELSGRRTNLLARAGEPEVVLCTHLDTVPPWFGPAQDAELVHGRGACDAKGPALAMVEAATALLATGERRVGLLFTVGEEVDSAGAQLAERRLAPPWRPRFTIVGEPTENRFVRGHKGLFKAELAAHGVAGHSSEPLGPSAVHELVRASARLLAADWGRDELFGAGSLNIGEIRGGTAANVVADAAEAQLLVRAVEPPERVAVRLRAALSEHVELRLGKGYGPQEFLVPGGGDGPIVGFGTDAPFLTRWGTRLLVGPGRIQDAHTDHERLSKRAFHEAVALYGRTAAELLATAC